MDSVHVLLDGWLRLCAAAQAAAQNLLLIHEPHMQAARCACWGSRLTRRSRGGWRGPMSSTWMQQTVFTWTTGWQCPCLAAHNVTLHMVIGGCADVLAMATAVRCRCLPWHGCQNSTGIDGQALYDRLGAPSSSSSGSSWRVRQHPST